MSKSYRELDLKFKKLSVQVLNQPCLSQATLKEVHHV